MSEKSRPTTATEISYETRMMRQFVEQAIKSNTELISYDQAGEAIHKSGADKLTRDRLRDACRWSEKHHEGVAWECETNVGFRRLKAKEGADLLGVARRKVNRKLRRDIRRTENLTRGVTLEEDDQKRLFVELTATSTMLTIGGSNGMKKIASRVQSEELPPAEILKLFTDGGSK